MNHRNNTPNRVLWIMFISLALANLSAQEAYVLKPDRVFDGYKMEEGWIVVVEGNYITEIGPENKVEMPSGARIILLGGTTLLPGLIDGHSHLLLHPYDEASWNRQVLEESHAERIARATVHAQKTLMAGFTTIRDLGTEGAGYADVGIKMAIEKGIIPGPRMIVAGRAIVATGSYGPKGFAPHVKVPLGAEEASGTDELVGVVRNQIANGADVIKVYADYRWGPNGEARPTFSESELKIIVETAQSSGRDVVAHASTDEGMRRAIRAGVSTIEHGDGGSEKVFKLMATRGVALCPTLAAGDAISQYQGWQKDVDPEPERIVQKKKTFRWAMNAEVLICAGGDVGVFPHGDNVRELELMVEYGMKPIEVLRSATSINAMVFKMSDQIGVIKPGLLADLIAVEGDPEESISVLRQIKMIMKDGVIIKKD